MHISLSLSVHVFSVSTQDPLAPPWFLPSQVQFFRENGWTFFLLHLIHSFYCLRFLNFLKVTVFSGCYKTCHYLCCLVNRSIREMVMGVKNK
jgi:hypothetical protein